MAKSARYRMSARQAAVDAITALLNGGTLEIRTLAQPADPGDADTGVLLATLALGNPAFAAANASGIAIANAITADASADATGTAAHYTAKSSLGVVITQGSIGGTAQADTSGTVNLLLSTTAIVAGAQVSVTSWQMGPMPLESAA